MKKEVTLWGGGRSNAGGAEREIRTRHGEGGTEREAKERESEEGGAPCKLYPQIVIIF